MSREHTLDASQIHHDWDASRDPVLAIEPLGLDDVHSRRRPSHG